MESSTTSTQETTMRSTLTTTTALAALTLLAACSNDSTAEPEARPSVTKAAVTPDYVVPGASHLSGPARWGIQPFGDVDAPLAVLDVPSGFQGHESWVWTDEQGPRAFAQLSYWTPTSVMTDPCRRGSAAPVGPEVADLVAAIQAQERTVTSRPERVTIDGHDGLYVELTTPPRLDHECPAMHVWGLGSGGTREVEQRTTDRYWVLDVDGQRVVVVAMTWTGARTDTVDLITGVARGVTFVEPA